MSRLPRFALLVVITWFAAVAAACGGGDSDSPIQVKPGSSRQDDTVRPRLPTRTARPNLTATCGLGGEVAAAHTEEGRLISPRPPEPVEPFDGWVTPKADAGLATTIARSMGEGAADLGVVVLSLVDRRGASIAPERSFYAASLFKLTVLYEVYRQRELGTLSFDERLLYTPYYEQFDLTGRLCRCAGRSVSATRSTR